MTNARRRQDAIARDITNALATAVQVRLLLAGFEPVIPASEFVAYLAMKNRALDLELALRDLAAKHPMKQGAAPSVSVATEPPKNVH